MNFIDIFAGAGGLSEGFIRAGFTPLAHVEMNKEAALTLKTRTAYHELLKRGKLEIYNSYMLGEITREDLYNKAEIVEKSVINCEISDETIDSIFSLIDENLSRLGQNKVDLLIGGPPCQAYSLVGRARDPYKKERDPRNYLYLQYAKFLKRYKPKMFVFENVPGILTAGKGQLFNDVKEYLADAGYDVDAQLLDASNFGVLQKRRRVILIGWRKRSGLQYPIFETALYNYTIRDILSDLPCLQPGQSSKHGERYLRTPSEYLSQFGIRSEHEILTQHVARPHNERDREIYAHVIRTWDREKRRLKYNELPDQLKTHKNQEAFLDRFKVVGVDEPYSHTLVAHIAKDGHYYIHPDIDQLRSLTIREAARIQSFPDNFYFEGPRTAAFTQIGNAVPPLMSQEIANKIKVQLEG